MIDGDNFGYSLDWGAFAAVASDAGRNADVDNSDGSAAHDPVVGSAAFSYRYSG